MDRRLFLGLTFASLGRADGDPWTVNQLMEPVALAREMTKPKEAPAIFCVAFPVLYRQKHIQGATFAGPGSKEAGIDSLKKALSALPKSREIVLYCGCCPMDHCPNVRPSFRAAKALGFSRVRVLNLPTNFHSDWVSKGYPVETRVPMS